MAGLAPGQLKNRQSTRVSLIDVLCQAPRLYQLLPRCSRQKLSATCSYLHQWVRETTTCVTLKHSKDLPRVTPEKWPKLVGVVLQYTSRNCCFDSKGLVQDKWQLDAQICCSASILCQNQLILLVSPLGNSQQANFELTPQQCQLLYQCTAKVREKTTSITVGPQQQAPDKDDASSACSALWLPCNLWSCFSSREWPKMHTLDMRSQQCSLACAHGFLTCSFPALRKIIWNAGQLSAETCAVLSQACLPSLESLSLSSQGLSATALPELSQASWPNLFILWLAKNDLEPLALAALSNSSSSWYRSLEILTLDGNVLGEEGVRALGLGQWEALYACNLSNCSIRSHAAVTCLAQVHFPKLELLYLTGNGFEAGALARLSSAHWPAWRSLVLGFQDLDERDYDVLDISDSHYSESMTPLSSIFGGLHHCRVYPTGKSCMLSSVQKIYVQNQG